MSDSGQPSSSIGVAQCDSQDRGEASASEPASGQESGDDASEVLVAVEIEKTGSSEIRDDILRGAPLGRILKPSLWRTSPCDLPPGSRKALWDYSKQCKELDIFISQTWGTPGWQKYMVLLMHFYWAPAMVAGGVTLVGLTALDVLGVTPSFEIGHRTIFGWEGNPKVSPCVLLVPLVAIGSLFLGPYLSRSKTLVFFDAVCINQDVEELKQDGINSLGGFVAKSKELLILWTPLYLSRAWCVYELAMFVKLRSDGVINVCPLFQHLTIFFGALSLTACCACWSVMNYMESSDTNEGLMMFGALALLTPMILLTHATRPYIAQRRQLDQQLNDFEVAKAESREVADKEFIIASVKHHHGSEEDFNEYVRTSLKEVVDSLIPGIGLSWLDMVKMGFPIACNTVAWIVGYWRAGMPTSTMIATFAVELGDVLFLFPLAIRLHVALVSRFSRRHPSRVVDAAKTVLLGPALLVIVMLLINAAETSKEFGFAGCAAFLGLMGLLTAVVFAKDARHFCRCRRQCTGCCSCP